MSGSITFGPSDAEEAVCCYCGGILEPGQSRQLVWLPDHDDPDDAISAHAHTRCPI